MSDHGRSVLAGPAALKKAPRAVAARIGPRAAVADSAGPAAKNGRKPATGNPERPNAAIAAAVKELVGRNAEKLAETPARHGIAGVTADLDLALASAEGTVIFDAGSAEMRARLLGKVLAAGMHAYCEKPIAESRQDALAVAHVDVPYVGTLLSSSLAA
jgi:predicted dehydrogenase